MTNDELWTDSENNGWQQPKRKFSALHLSMLFATAVVAGAMVMTPILAGKNNTNVAAKDGINYDNVVTGSIGSISSGEQRTPNFGKKQYTIRHSITQSSGEACVIYDIDRLTDNCE
ncbi:MAG: hypothetical protein ABJN11_08960 [Lentilitoribacter sp.]